MAATALHITRIVRLFTIIAMVLAFFDKSLLTLVTSFIGCIRNSDAGHQDNMMKRRLLLLAATSLVATSCASTTVMSGSAAIPAHAADWSVPVDGGPM
ncbi:MAG TPA: hypothetical protein DCQ53_02190, partial [Alphaproteobacteria bacterium]|nr:hypothetical protein [Alphaproteobacteria bacterium]